MRKHSRFITILLSAIMLASAAMCAVSADELTPGEGEQNISEVTPGGEESNPGGEESAPGGNTGDDSYTEDPGYVEPSVVEPSHVDPGYVDPGYNEPSYVEPGNNEQSYDENTVFYDGDGNEYSSPSDVYVGGDQTYTPPVSIPSTTVAPKDVSKSSVGEPTMNDSDWENIRASFGNQGKQSDGKSSSTSFKQIKDNNLNGSGLNFNDWARICGIALLVLGLACMIYTIVSFTMARKRTGAARANKAAVPVNNTRYRDKDDYSDNYNTGSKKGKNGKRYK